MILSSMFHTFLCHSERVKYKWKEADHSGILIALWGTYTRLVVPVDSRHSSLSALWDTYSRFAVPVDTSSRLSAFRGLFSGL